MEVEGSKGRMKWVADKKKRGGGKGEGGRKSKMGRRKTWEVMRKQSQKRYMVSGSLRPLISFLDVSYSVSFVVRGQRPRRGR